ncbi:MAG: hypothetical protein GX811_12560, partial [Lentisphaerae bacterium]|nr:hypothetical protein [Lentisphaerota bacterium]
MKKRKTNTIKILFLALLLLLLSGMTGLHLFELRKNYQLDLAEPLEKAPPLVVFTTVALGGLRGMVAD